MEYEVLNHNNAFCKVTDADIEAAVGAGGPLPRAIVQAMGKTHDDRFLEYICPVLYDEAIYMRLDAAQGIINLNGRKGLEALKERERSIDPSDFDRLPCEKAVLIATIIRIEEGPEGILRYFRSEDGRDIVKYCLLSYYSSGYDFKEEDIRLISTILREFVDITLKRVKKVTRDDWTEFVYFALDSLLVAALESDVISHISDQTCGELTDVFKRILDAKATNDMKELMADISKSMRRDFALDVLKNLKGRAGSGDARRAYKKALKHFNLREEDL